MPKKTKLNANELRWRLEPKKLKFACTGDVPYGDELLAQREAVEALSLGLDICAPGYNIFIAGTAGSGRRSLVTKMVGKASRRQCKAPDRVYVHNFHNPNRPILINLARGKGAEFRQDMQDLFKIVLRNLAESLSDRQYKAERLNIKSGFNAAINETFQKFEEKIRKKNFILTQVEDEQGLKPVIVYKVKDQGYMHVQIREIQRILEKNDEEMAKIDSLFKRYNLELERNHDRIKEATIEMNRQLAELRRTTVMRAVQGSFDAIRKRYPDEKVDAHLQSMLKHTLDNLSVLIEEGSSIERNITEKEPLLEYQVNLLYDTSDHKGSPVVFENNPNLTNLFGTIERPAGQPGVAVDFMKIRAGSMLEADGGFLVLNADDLFAELGLWQALKRVLKSGLLTIQEIDAYGHRTVSALKPEPIPINTKVIILGNTYQYNLLYNMDPEFRKIYKVKVELDGKRELDPKGIDLYARVAHYLSDKEGLPHLTPDALALVVEEGVRDAGQRGKLSTRFGMVGDIIREAAYFAAKSKSKLIGKHEISSSLKARRARHNLAERRMEEQMERDVLMISTCGKAVGQINGLTVLSTGDHTFGRPARITASVGMGDEGIINIERRADLSGEIHDKGVYILTGFFRKRFGQDKPLNFTAAIGFEQSYGPVDGDSASSTEIYVLLSAISGLPLKQNLAVTGSVNQHGEIQPIGGANEKIEGFFDICSARGLDGEQGVIIPRRNVENLMLSEDVVEAVRAGMFHIHAIDTIEQGIELLTGHKAGLKGDGTYLKGSVYDLVDARLLELAEGLKEFNGGS